jgi:hypothetical protein
MKKQCAFQIRVKPRRKRLTKRKNNKIKQEKKKKDLEYRKRMRR